jgi:hypothetical protein
MLSEYLTGTLSGAWAGSMQNISTPGYQVRNLIS